jgi:hypothetical protein
VGVKDVGCPGFVGVEVGVLVPGVRSLRVTSTAPGRPEASEPGVLVGEVEGAGDCVTAGTVGLIAGVVVVGVPAGGVIGALALIVLGFEPPAGDKFG